MTEQEWLQSVNLRAMFAYVAGQATERKLRLFGCACCRRIWHLLGDKGQRAVAVAELFADGLTTEEERRVAFDANPWRVPGRVISLDWVDAQQYAEACARHAAACAVSGVGYAACPPLKTTFGYFK